MAIPWECSYTHYDALVKPNVAFEEDLRKAVRELLDDRTECSEDYYSTTKGCQVRWTINNINRVLASLPGSPRKFAPERAKDNKAPSLLIKSPVHSDSAQLTQDISAKPVKKPAAKAKKPDVCYTCGEEGHLARNCMLKSKTPFLCYHCGLEGHISRDCTVKVREEMVETDDFRSGLQTCDREVKRSELTQTGPYLGHLHRRCPEGSWSLCA
jgi:hypothetical protein